MLYLVLFILFNPANDCYNQISYVTEPVGRHINHVDLLKIKSDNITLPFWLGTPKYELIFEVEIKMKSQNLWRTYLNGGLCEVSVCKSEFTLSFYSSKCGNSFSKQQDMSTSQE